MSDQLGSGDRTMSYRTCGSARHGRGRVERRVVRRPAQRTSVSEGYRWSHHAGSITSSRKVQARASTGGGAPPPPAAEAPATKRGGAAARRPAPTRAAPAAPPGPSPRCRRRPARPPAPAATRALPRRALRRQQACRRSAAHGGERRGGGGSQRQRQRLDLGVLCRRGRREGAYERRGYHNADLIVVRDGHGAQPETPPGRARRNEVEAQRARHGRRQRHRGFARAFSHLHRQLRPVPHRAARQAGHLPRQASIRYARGPGPRIPPLDGMRRNGRGQRAVRAVRPRQRLHVQARPRAAAARAVAQPRGRPVWVVKGGERVRRQEQRLIGNPRRRGVQVKERHYRRSPAQHGAHVRAHVPLPQRQRRHHARVVTIMQRTHWNKRGHRAWSHLPCV